MVLYPTQLSSWKKYQNTDNKEQCGIPGVNGGYNHRLYQRLGVNCYGKKPEGVMPEESEEPEPQKPDPPDLTISPFNYSKWSEF